MSDEYLAWQQERRSYITSPTGNLACVSYHPVEGAVEIEEIPATAILERERGGVVLKAAAKDGVTVDGVLVDGETFVRQLQPATGTPVIRWSHYSLDVFSLDGSDYELRVYSSEAENLQRFDRVDYYDYDPALVMQGQFREFDHSHQVPWDFSRSSDSGHTKKVPGVIDLEVAGVKYELAGFVDGPLLVLVFADETTGKESYAPGRFLKMPTPDHSGTVTLDFNLTFIPPCGFSDFYSCPVPPPQNRIAAPIRGGERKVLWNQD